MGWWECIAGNKAVIPIVRLLWLVPYSLGIPLLTFKHRSDIVDYFSCHSDRKESMSNGHKKKRLEIQRLEDYDDSSGKRQSDNEPK